jgi:hypothetical protein
MILQKENGIREKGFVVTNGNTIFSSFFFTRLQAIQDAGRLVNNIPSHLAREWWKDNHRELNLQVRKCALVEV